MAVSKSDTVKASRFSFKAFGTGLLVVVLVYALLGVYLLLTQEKSVQSLEASLASQTVLIDGMIDELRPQPTAVIDKTPALEEIQTEDGLNPEDQVQAPTDAATSEAENDISEAAPEETPAETPVTAVKEEPAGNRALDAVPKVGLFEESSYGRLPVAKGPDETPFLAYKKPYVLNLNKPFISVVMRDFGLSRELSMKMIKDLPSSVSFILSPYSTAPDNWVQKAREDGHEVWLEMPVETNAFPMKDPGSKGLLTRVSLQYNQDRLGWLLGRTTGYTGVAVFTDSALDNAGQMFKNIARSMSRRGLGYLELNPAGGYFKDVAQEEGTPRAQNSALIDFLINGSEAQEKAMFRINGNGGDIVVIAPTANNIEAAKNWLNELQNQGIQSAPVSAVAAANSGL